MLPSRGVRGLARPDRGAALGLTGTITREKEDELTREIDELEARVHGISERFLDPALSGKGGQKEVRRLEEEQKKLQARIAELMAEWEQVERELEAAS